MNRAVDPHFSRRQISLLKIQNSINDVDERIECLRSKRRLLIDNPYGIEYQSIRDQIQNLYQEKVDLVEKEFEIVSKMTNIEFCYYIFSQ